MGNIVHCYDTERTICDILRSRNRIDEETVISAVKNYAKEITFESIINLLSKIMK